MVTRRSVEAGGRRLSYLEKGIRRDGELSLVLIHGLMGTAATFLPLLAEIPEQQHVIAVDLPGAGGSEHDPKMGASLAAAVGSVIKALDALDLQVPVLIGHSHGGSVAMYLAALYPERVNGLVLLAPAHPYFRHADQLIRFYVSPLGKVFAHTLPWYPQWVQMAGLRRMAGPKSWDAPERLVPYPRKFTHARDDTAPAEAAANMAHRPGRAARPARMSVPHANVADLGRS